MFFLKILLGLVLLDIMVIAHEMGHYITARLFNVDITEFAIGMGPKIISKVSKKTGIRYSLRAFPVGGYVAMVGEEEDSENPNSLNKKVWWQRLIIDLAGITMNLLLGVFLMLIFVGASPYNSTPYATTTVNEMKEDGASMEAGLQKGDIIKKVNGNRVRNYADLSLEIMLDGAEPVTLLIERDGQEQEIIVNFTTQDAGQGLTIGQMDFNTTLLPKTFLRSLGRGFSMVGWGIKFVWKSFAGLITGKFSIKQMSSPLGVTEAIGETAIGEGASMLALLDLCAIITLNFAVFNLLPFPALDGGHALMRVCEGISRKKVPAKVEAILNLAGISVLMLLMIWTFANDIIRMFIT